MDPVPVLVHGPAGFERRQPGLLPALRRRRVLDAAAWLVERSSRMATRWSA